MNFTQPSDFLYVTGANVDSQHPNGDLDRIVIDNDIMPVRSPADKRIIRGMDVAFLMEAVEERARLINLSPCTFTFSCVVSLDQVNSIISRLNEIISALGYRLPNYVNKPMVAKPSALLIDEWKSIDNQTSYNLDFYNHIEQLYAIQSITDRVIYSDDIDDLFSVVKKLNIMMLKSPGANYVSSSVNSFTSYTVPNVSASGPDAQYVREMIFNLWSNYDVYRHQRVRFDSRESLAWTTLDNISVTYNQSYVKQSIVDLCDLDNSIVGIDVHYLCNDYYGFVMKFLDATRQLYPTDSQIIQTCQSVITESGSDRRDLYDRSNVYLYQIVPIVTLRDRTRW